MFAPVDMGPPRRTAAVRPGHQGVRIRARAWWGEAIRIAVDQRNDVIVRALETAPRPFSQQPAAWDRAARMERVAASVGGQPQTETSGTSGSFCARATRSWHRPSVVLKEPGPPSARTAPTPRATRWDAPLLPQSSLISGRSGLPSLGSRFVR